MLLTVKANCWIGWYFYFTFTFQAVIGTISNLKSHLHVHEEVDYDRGKNMKQPCCNVFNHACISMIFYCCMKRTLNDSGSITWWQSSDSTWFISGHKIVAVSILRSRGLLGDGNFTVFLLNPSVLIGHIPFINILIICVLEANEAYSLIGVWSLIWTIQNKK